MDAGVEERGASGAIVPTILARRDNVNFALKRLCDSPTNDGRPPVKKLAADIGE